MHLKVLKSALVLKRQDSRSKVHDEILWDEEQGYTRKTNNAGGLEGGMTTGMPIVVRGVMKPIPTLYKPLASVDIDTKEAFQASIERSIAVQYQQQV